MKENIAVNKAIEKGKGLINFVSILILVIGLVFSVYIYCDIILGNFATICSIILTIVVTIFFRGFAVTKWRIWAFENVRNVHELKRKAILNNLIFEDGSYFEKMIIVNYDQKQKLRLLEKKFQEKDIYHDDVTIPKESFIYLSKIATVLLFVFAILIIVGGVFTYFDDKSEKYLFVFLISIGFFMLYKGIMRTKNKEPQIVINSDGIKLQSSEIMSWEDIKNDCVSIRRMGKQVIHFLSLDYKNKHIEFEINKLNTNFNKLEKLLQVYRVRFEKKS